MLYADDDPPPRPLMFMFVPVLDIILLCTGCDEEAYILCRVGVLLRAAPAPAAAPPIALLLLLIEAAAAADADDDDAEPYRPDPIAEPAPALCACAARMAGVGDVPLLCAEAIVGCSRVELTPEEAVTAADAEPGRDDAEDDDGAEVLILCRPPDDDDAA